jgi:hypothetical protein
MGASNMVWRGKLAAETISIPCSNPDLKKKKKRVLVGTEKRTLPRCLLIFI